jgi:hypothetical protein
MASIVAPSSVARPDPLEPFEDRTLLSLGLLAP